MNKLQSLKVGCRVQINNDDHWHHVARVGQGYITLHDFNGVVWFHSITDIRE